MRKMATIRRVGSIDPIPGADAIEVATVDGWKVVVKKGEFTAGELVVYCEIDSFIPTELAPFLSKGKEPREYNGVKGERLRTVKLRGQISQGLLLCLEDVFPAIESMPVEGLDVSDILNIQKWEPPLPGQLVGQAKGYFPEFLRKTDQERIQNCFKEVVQDWSQQYFEVTTKLDGSSCTVYYKDGQFGVCSRNLELKINEDNKDNTFVRIAHDTLLNVALESMGRNVAIQGELMGPGIQGNRENFPEHRLYVFDVFLIDEQRYMLPHERYDFMDDLERCGVFQYKLQHVPVLETIKLDRFETVEDFLAYAEGPSIDNKVREGVVFKSCDFDYSFKVISNSFLLKGGE